MSSEQSTLLSPTPRPFSTRPGVDYWLAIAIPLVLFWFYQIWRLRYCGQIENPLGSDLCRRDYELNVETGGHQAQVLFWYTFLIPVPLLSIPLLAAIDAPLFLVALYLERRVHISKRVTGFTYWLVAWILIGLSPLLLLWSVGIRPSLIGGKALADLKDAAESATPFFMLVLHGTATGLVYCTLGLLRRNRTSSI